MQLPRALNDEWSMVKKKLYGIKNHLEKCTDCEEDTRKERREREEKN